MQRKKRVRDVAEKIQIVVNSSVFTNLFLKSVFSGENSPWKDKSNMEILRHFRSGAETLSPRVDNVADIYIDDYFSWKGVIGYTYPSVKWIYVNTRFFDRRSDMLIGSNIVHEYGHKVGFKHDFRRTRRRNYSICYQLNRIFEQSYLSLFPNDRPVVRKTRKPWYKRLLNKIVFWR